MGGSLSDIVVFCRGLNFHLLKVQVYRLGRAHGTNVTVAAIEWNWAVGLSERLWNLKINFWLH